MTAFKADENLPAFKRRRSTSRSRVHPRTVLSGCEENRKCRQRAVVSLTERDVRPVGDDNRG